MNPFRSYRTGSKDVTPAIVSWLAESCPLLKLSFVQRRQKWGALLMIPLMFVWVGTIFGAIALIRPLMVERSEYYGLLILAWMLLSVVPLWLAMCLIYHALGLVCPYCDTAFVKDDYQTPDEAAAENLRRCMKCHAQIIDLNA